MEAEKPPDNWPEGGIEFINYSTRYRDDLDLVLHSISFSVRPGEKVGPLHTLPSPPLHTPLGLGTCFVNFADRNCWSHGIGQILLGARPLPHYRGSGGRNSNRWAQHRLSGIARPAWPRDSHPAGERVPPPSCPFPAAFPPPPRCAPASTATLCYCDVM